MLGTDISLETVQQRDALGFDQSILQFVQERDVRFSIVAFQWTHHVDDEGRTRW